MHTYQAQADSMHEEERPLLGVVQVPRVLIRAQRGE